MAGPETNRIISASSTCKCCYSVDSERQHKSIVIIRMLTNKVDPPRSPGCTIWSHILNAIRKSCRKMSYGVLSWLWQGSRIVMHCFLPLLQLPHVVPEPSELVNSHSSTYPR